MNRENRNHDYTKFAVTREECNIVIKQNIDKGRMISRVSDSIVVSDSTGIVALFDNGKEIWYNKKHE